MRNRENEDTQEEVEYQDIRPVMRRQLTAIHLGLADYLSVPGDAKIMASALVCVAQGFDIALRSGVRGLTYDGANVVGMAPEPEGSFFSFILEDGSVITPDADEVCEPGVLWFLEEPLPLPVAAIRMLEVGIETFALARAHVAGSA